MAFTKTVSHGLLAFSVLTGLAVIGLWPQPAAAAVVYCKTVGVPKGCVARSAPAVIACTVPGVPVDVLLAPVGAPWMRASEGIDFARAVGAPRNLAIHDRVYSEAGLGIVDGHMARFLDPAGQSYSRLADGADLEL